MVYDLIIIGGGPAAVAAAVYAARKKLKTLLIAMEFGGQSTVSEKIYNWIGTIALSGHELAENLKNHVLANVGEDLSLLEGEEVSSLSDSSDSSGEQKLFKVKTKSGKEFIAKTLLIASGSRRRKLTIKNADRLEHKGLTYCASCDGPLFAGRDVAVIGGGNAGFETAAQLLAYCNSVTLLEYGDTFRADQITVQKVLKNPKMKALNNVEMLELKGEKFVEGIIYKTRTDPSGEIKELNVSGIFVEIGGMPNTDFVNNLVPLDNLKRIKIDPTNQKTQTKNIWAAGDCTDCLYHQNNIAVGDGVRALEDIFVSLSTK